MGERGAGGNAPDALPDALPGAFPDALPGALPDAARAAIERARRDYGVGALDEADLGPDPLVELARWIEAAAAAGIDEPNAMTLATVDADGRPDARVVLLRRLDHGVVWFTNRSSAKGAQLATSPHAAVVLHWQPLERQVRLRGEVAELTDAESDDYFGSRPRGSRIAAWASEQSRPIADRVALEARFAAAEARFAGRPDAATAVGEGDTEPDVPRPSDWGGYRLVPDVVEFWQGRRSRLHDRLVYRRDGVGWHRERLQP